MNMFSWSFFNQKQNAPFSVNSGDNLNWLQVAKNKKHADFKVSSLGSIWGEWKGGYRGILLFNITQYQSAKPLLKHSRVNISFDCHPRNNECHKAGKSGCHIDQDKLKYDRGTVTYSSPTHLEGEETKVHIDQHDEIEVEPKVNVPPFAEVGLGAFRRYLSKKRVLRASWVFKSSISPPLYYKNFHERTDVRYDWEENSMDIMDSPSEFQLVVIVDFKSVDSSRLLMTLTIDLAPRGSYWSERDTTQHCFDVQNTPENLSHAVEMIDRRSSETLPEKNPPHHKPFQFVTFRVHDTSQHDDTIKLVGTGGPLGGWDRSAAIVLNRNLHDRTQWHVTVLAEVGSTFEYKFIKELGNGSGFSWQRGDNRAHTVSAISGDPKSESPEWE